MSAMRSFPLCLAAVLLLLAAPALATFGRDFCSTQRLPLVVAHRGASGDLPEHTLEAYKKAIDDGADMIECDMVLTKDLVVMCRHEPVLDETTDAGSKFANRTTTYIVDGIPTTGVFATDLTLAEMKTLRAKERLPNRNQDKNFLYGIPTLQDQIDLVKQYASQGRIVGLYPETKHPNWTNSILQQRNPGQNFNDIVLKTLQKNGYALDSLCSKGWQQKPIFLQSFEFGNLKYIRDNLARNVPLVFLLNTVSSEDGRSAALWSTDEELTRMSQTVNVIAPTKSLMVNTGISAQERSIFNPAFVTDLAKRIRAKGMQVHTWTLRDDTLPGGATGYYRGNPCNEFAMFYDIIGVNGLFTDYARTGVAYLDGKCPTNLGFREGPRAPRFTRKDSDDDGNNGRGNDDKDKDDNKGRGNGKDGKGDRKLL